MRIMLSAAGSAVAPSIIRHLQSLGHYVIGHDCNGFADLRSPPVNEPDYLWFIEATWYDLYLPFLDEELRRFSVTPVKRGAIHSPADTLRAFTNKFDQHVAMSTARLPVVPIALCPTAIIKPMLGRGSKNILVTDNYAIADAALKSGAYLVQRFIDGYEYTIDVLTDRDGAFLFAVPRLRIQASGVSVIGKIVMDEEIIDLARQIVSKFKFAGPINIQVIRERDTGKLYIIEVNPRLSGSCMFTVMAGFDILDATIRLWEGKPFVPPSKIEDGLIIRRHYVEERL